MSEDYVEGGVSTTSKLVKWKLRNFAPMFIHESLVKRQQMFFDVTDSRGVTSRWLAHLDFQTLPDKDNMTDTEPAINTEPEKCLGLIITFISTSSSLSSVCAKVTPEIEGKEGEIIFKGLHGNDCEFTEGRKRISWAIKTLKKDSEISHRLMEDGSMVIKLDLLIFDSVSDCPTTLKVGQLSDNFLESEMTWKRKCEIQRDVSSMENDEANSDVKIVSNDGREFFAYRWILRGASDVFDAMFRVNMKEKNTGVVKFEDLSGTAVNVLLHYVYTGEMMEEWKNPGVVEQIVYAADKFQIRSMQMYLSLRLGKLCTLENAATLLTLAKQTGLKLAVVGILKFVQENIRDCDSFFSVFNNVSTAATTGTSHAGMGVQNDEGGGEDTDMMQTLDTAQNKIENQIKPENNSGGSGEGCSGGHNNAAVLNSPIAPSSRKRTRYK